MPVISFQGRLDIFHNRAAMSGGEQGTAMDVHLWIVSFHRWKEKTSCLAWEGQKNKKTNKQREK